MKGFFNSFFKSYFLKQSFTETVAVVAFNKKLGMGVSFIRSIQVVLMSLTIKIIYLVIYIIFFKLILESKTGVIGNIFFYELI